MKIMSIAELDIQPDFDFSTFLFLAQVDEVGPQEMLAVLDVWERWLPMLKIYKLGDRKGHVLIYLEQGVEDEVDKVWADSPSEGFKHEAIAQTMIMGSLKGLMPELGEKECAPVPEPTKPLASDRGEGRSRTAGVRRPEPQVRDHHPLSPPLRLRALSSQGQLHQEHEFGFERDHERREGIRAAVSSRSLRVAKGLDHEVSVQAAQVGRRVRPSTAFQTSSDSMHM